MHRKFEPTRLSQATLEQAYAKVVAQHIRVVSIPAEQLEDSKPEYQPVAAGELR